MKVFFSLLGNIFVSETKLPTHREEQAALHGDFRDVHDANDEIQQAQVTFIRLKRAVYDTFVQFGKSDLEHLYEQTSQKHVRQI